ncbi:MAG TPA: methyltransferase domain-containing protein [Actinomycetota bacterium]|jgi:SAM-dependent methyltransferase
MSVAVECEVLPGLEPFVVEELERVLGGRARVEPVAGRGAVRLGLSGPPGALLGLRTPVAAYLVVRFPGRRPSALLGDGRLFAQVETVRGLHPAGAFGSFRLSVPGRDSTAVRRLVEELTRRTGLAYDPEDGELLLRIRRTPGGWELLTRLSPRPLATRPWRVRHLPGAVNATIAAAMVELTRPRPGDRVLNLMCGSGTLLVERLARGPAASALGCDLDPGALAGARANLAAAGLRDRLALARMDATRLGLRDGCVDALLADLPYGHRMGSHEGNTELYPAVLREAGRVAAPGARLVVLTHELRLFERCLAGARAWWRPERATQVFQKGHHPVMHLLRRERRAG